MLKSTILIICCGVALLHAKPALDESAAKKFIIESSDKYLEVYTNLAETIFGIQTLISSDDSNESKESKEVTKASSENKVSTSDSSEMSSDEAFGFFAFFFILAQIGKFFETMENITTLSEEAYRFPVDQYTDEEVKIGILKLKTMAGIMALGDDYNTWSEDDFDDFLDNENYCKYKDEESCDNSFSDLAKILKTSTDPEEILFYWKEWRDKNAEAASTAMPKFIELLQKLGTKYGKDGKFVWFEDYLDENFDVEMEKVVKDLEPLFKELHAYIRHALHQQYGDKVPENGLIPHHLYEQAVSQAWAQKSIIAKEFDGVRMPIENNFNETAPEIMQIASNFMKSLGLSELPEDFWTERAKPNEKKGDDCSSDIYDGGNTTYFVYCKEVNIRKFLQMHGNLARIYYANERKNLPFAYSSPYNFEVAVGEAVVLAAGTPKYLHEIGHKDVNVLPEDENMNRLYRMGVHTLLSVPEFFVNVKVVADVLAGTTTVKDMNKHYWDLMAKYVGVAPPVERTAESFDFPYKFYKNIENNQQSMKFISEVMGYQIYESLCEKSGEYVKGDKTLQLHNCNFHNSKEAGATLKHMMQLGSKKPWKQLLGTVTGDDSGMKAEPMLEYYEPLQKWLHTKNTEHGVTVGW